MFLNILRSLLDSCSTSRAEAPRNDYVLYHESRDRNSPVRLKKELGNFLAGKLGAADAVKNVLKETAAWLSDIKTKHPDARIYAKREKSFTFSNQKKQEVIVLYQAKTSSNPLLAFFENLYRKSDEELARKVFSDLDISMGEQKIRQNASSIQEYLQQASLTQLISGDAAKLTAQNLHGVLSSYTMESSDSIADSGNDSQFPLQVEEAEGLITSDMRARKSGKTSDLAIASKPEEIVLETISNPRPQWKRGMGYRKPEPLANRCAQIFSSAASFIGNAGTAKNDVAKPDALLQIRAQTSEERQITDQTNTSLSLQCGEEREALAKAREIYACPERAHAENQAKAGSENSQQNGKNGASKTNASMSGEQPTASIALQANGAGDGRKRRRKIREAKIEGENKNDLNTQCKKEEQADFKTRNTHAGQLIGNKTSQPSKASRQMDAENRLRAIDVHIYLTKADWECGDMFVFTETAFAYAEKDIAQDAFEFLGMTKGKKVDSKTRSASIKGKDKSRMLFMPENNGLTDAFDPAVDAAKSYGLMAQVAHSAQVKNLVVVPFHPLQAAQADRETAMDRMLDAIGGLQLLNAELQVTLIARTDEEKADLEAGITRALPRITERAEKMNHAAAQALDASALEEGAGICNWLARTVFNPLGLGI